jgi:hypothetical protein
MLNLLFKDESMCVCVCVYVCMCVRRPAAGHTQLNNNCTFDNSQQNFHLIVDAHRGIKVYPSYKIFAKFVNKNAIKHQKGVSFPQIFHNPYIPSLLKFGKNLMDPPPRFSNCVLLCIQSMSFIGENSLV